MPFDFGSLPDENRQPGASEVTHLRATNGAGALHVALASLGTGLALAASWQGGAWWLAGQVALGVLLVNWFVVLHEAGHGTLFASRSWNVAAGHLAGFLTVLPFTSWKSVHNLHHKWTGWQDRDPTTAALVPRPLARVERVIIDTAWRFWLPLFSVLYRTRNYWHLPRLKTLLPVRTHRALVVNALLQLAVYAAVAVALGPVRTLALFGLATFVSMVLMDPIMLSQHTHVPLKVAGALDVAPIGAREQAPYTRTLAFPRPVSRWWLLGFDAHELHHVYPQVPGHLLARIPWRPPGVFEVVSWLRQVKRLPGHVFLFKNRNDTGLHV